MLPPLLLLLLLRRCPPMVAMPNQLSRCTAVTSALTRNVHGKHGPGLWALQIAEGGMQELQFSSLVFARGENDRAGGRQTMAVHHPRRTFALTTAVVCNIRRKPWRPFYPDP